MQDRLTLPIDQKLWNRYDAYQKTLLENMGLDRKKGMLWGPRTSRPKYPCAYISDPMISVSLSTIELVIKEHP